MLLIAEVTTPPSWVVDSSVALSASSAVEVMPPSCVVVSDCTCEVFSEPIWLVEKFDSAVAVEDESAVVVRIIEVPKMTDAELKELDKAGVKGVRFNFIKRLVDSTPKDVMQRIAARIAGLGWHIVIYFEHADLDEMGPFLKSIPTPLVFDHMACPNVREGVDGKHFQNWLKALDANRTWITKVTCTERFTVAGPPYDDVAPFGRAIVERFPDRVIWGTDWPHPNMPKEAPDDGVLVDFITKIAPTVALQQALLVDNPMRLYWS